LRVAAVRTACGFGRPAAAAGDAAGSRLLNVAVVILSEAKDLSRAVTRHGQ